MGKSAAAAILAEAGTPVVDTDEIAREVVAPGSPVLQEIAREFGAEVLGSDGALRRGALAAIVFSKPSARLTLEKILHPLIRQKWSARAEEWRKNGVSAGVVVIPLLFETGAEQEFERVICIACNPELQSTRLQTRGWNAEQVSGRLAAQWPIEKKMDRSHYVIWNDADVSVLREQLRRVPPLKADDKPADQNQTTISNESFKGLCGSANEPRTTR
jgi:dephospho-CoA kinase